MPPGVTGSRTVPEAPLLSVRGLHKHFPLRRSLLEAGLARLRREQPQLVRAVDGVSFDLHRSETLGIVGESGCGKTTLGRTVLRLLEPSEGAVVFEGTDLCSLARRELRRLRPRMQIVFQDPAASLNPRKSTGQIIRRALRVAGVRQRAERQKRMAGLLRSVRLEPEAAGRYPHQLSGGQKQRVSIARALATEPAFIVADEPVSSLDVSVQAQILRILAELQQERGLSLLFISHDLSVVRQVSHRIAVMYLGKIVEIGRTSDVIGHPAHPYTQSLLAAVPRLRRRRLLSQRLLAGETPSATSPPTGCHFHPRCPASQIAACQERSPDVRDLGGGHSAACHLLNREEEA